MSTELIVCPACGTEVPEDETGFPTCAAGDERLCSECLNDHTGQCRTCYNDR
jgi:hypothetical protein